MCEKLPGPRCSPDVRNKLVKLTQQIENKQIEVKQKQSDYNASRLIDYEDSYDDSDHAYAIYNEAVYARDALKAEQQKLMLQYDATPEGFNSLQSLIDVTGSAITKNNVSYYDFNAEPDKYYEDYGVKLPSSYALSVPKKSLLKNRLSTAKEHREWQTTIGRALKNAEKKSHEKASFIAEAIADGVAKAEITETDNIKQLSHTRDTLVQKYANSGFKDIETKEKLEQAYLAHHASVIRRQYINIQKEDIDTYIKNSPKVDKQAVYLNVLNTK